MAVEGSLTPTPASSSSTTSAPRVVNALWDNRLGPAWLHPSPRTGPECCTGRDVPCAGYPETLVNRDRGRLRRGRVRCSTTPLCRGVVPAACCCCSTASKLGCSEKGQSTLWMGCRQAGCGLGAGSTSCRPRARLESARRWVTWIQWRSNGPCAATMSSLPSTARASCCLISATCARACWNMAGTGSTSIRTGRRFRSSTPPSNPSPGGAWLRLARPIARLSLALRKALYYAATALV